MMRSFKMILLAFSLPLVLFANISNVPFSSDQANPCSSNYSFSALNNAGIVVGNSYNLQSWTPSSYVNVISAGAEADMAPPVTTPNPTLATLNLTIPANTFSSNTTDYTVQVCVKSGAYSTEQGKPLSSPSLLMGDDTVLQRGVNISYINAANDWEVYREVFHLGKNGTASPIPITLSFAGVTDPATGQPATASFKNFVIVQGALPTISDTFADGANTVDSPYFNADSVGNDWPNANQSAAHAGDGNSQAETLPAGIDTPPLTSQDQVAGKTWADLQSPQVLEIDEPTTQNAHIQINSKLYDDRWFQQSTLQATSADYILTAEVYIPAGENIYPVPTVSIMDKNNPDPIDHNAPSIPIDPKKIGQWQQIQIPFRFLSTPSGSQIAIYWYQGSAANKIYITSVEVGYLSVNPASTHSIKTTTLPLVEDFNSYQKGEMLDPAKWLLPRRTIGSSFTQDYAGVFPYNVIFAQDNDDNNQPESILRLRFFGGDDSSAAEMKAWGNDFFTNPDANGYSREERQGGAVVTNNYYDSGTYVFCVKFPYDNDDYVNPSQPAGTYPHRYDTGVVSAFWPFNYQNLLPGQDGYNDQPSPIRNYELDWEIPAYNQANDPSELLPVSYGLSRFNVWGGEWSGEGGNMTSRPYATGPDSLTALNKGQLLDDGKFHQIAFVINSGADKDPNTGIKNPNGGKNSDDPNATAYPRGYVAWYFNSTCQVQDTLRSTSTNSVSTFTYYSKNDTENNETAMRAVLDPIINPENPNYKNALGTLLQIQTMDDYDAPNLSTQQNPLAGYLPGMFTGNNYGYDNIPKKAMRLWFATWSPGALDYTVPAGNYPSNGAENNASYWWGWGGTPDFVHEDETGGVADFHCKSTKLSPPFDPGLSGACAWANDPNAVADPSRIQFLQTWFTQANVNPVMSGFTTTSGHHFTNERDLDVSSVVVLPVSATAAATHPDTTSSDPDFFTNNFLCANASQQIPADCNADAEGKIFTKADVYPVMADVPPGPTPTPGNEAAPVNVKFHFVCDPTSDANQMNCTGTVTWDDPQWKSGYELDPMITDEITGGPVATTPALLASAGATGNSAQFTFSGISGHDYIFNFEVFSSNDSTLGVDYDSGNYAPSDQ